MKRVLITGASGFIGRLCLQPLLEKGYEVHALSSRIQSQRDRVHWHHFDLLSEASINSLLKDIAPTHLLHLAWNAEPGKYWNAPDNIDWVRASLALLRSFYTQGGQRLVMAGSCAEYDWSNGECSENATPLKPTALYGKSKAALFELAQSYAQTFGHSFAWGRIFLLYGEHEYKNRLVSSIALSLLQGQMARCTHGEQIRDFTYVKDVASAFVALLESEVQGPVNIGSGQPIQVKEIMLRLAQKLKAENLLQLGALPFSEAPAFYPTVTRLRDEVGWKPSISLDEGLDLSLVFWKEQLLQQNG